MKQIIIRLTAFFYLLAVLCACDKKDVKTFGDQVKALEIVSVMEPFQPEENPGGYS